MKFLLAIIILFYFYPGLINAAEGSLPALKVKLHGGFLLTEAEVAGQKGTFIIDTGAPNLVLNDRYWRKGKRLYRASGIAGELEVGTIQVKHFKWAGIYLRRHRALTLPLDHLEHAIGQPIAGLIGYEVYKDYELLIDYQRQEIKLSKERSALPTDNWQVIPFELEQHIVVIEAKIGNENIRLGLDTGSESNLLDEGVIHQLMPSVFTSLPDQMLRGLDQKMKKVQVVQVKATSIEDQVFREIRFLSFPLTEQCAKFEIEIGGLLGAPFFRQGKVAINYRERKLYLSDSPGLHAYLE